MSISLDTQLAKKLDQGMRFSDAIELPFPIVYIWAFNGQASYKTLGGALYYGGWACKSADMDAVAEQQNLKVPQDWKRVTIPTRDGSEYEAYTTRSLIVAPIGKRESWLHDGTRSTDYIEGGRRHLQVLAYLAEAKGNNGNRTFEPWGPVVLTAKGYQARNLMDAFIQWNRATNQVRWKVAPRVPAWCFYLAIGTFGQQRQVVNVGKPGAQSPITPIEPYITNKMDEELISSLFVGEEVAKRMAELQDQAQEWLNAWSETEVMDEVPYQESSFSEPGTDEPEEIPF